MTPVPDPASETPPDSALDPLDDLRGAADSASAGSDPSGLGNVVVAVCGVVGSALLVWAGTRQRLGIGLLAILLLAVTTAVAAHTAVVADKPGWPRRVLGGVVATGLFLGFASSEASALVPVVALGAGIGRTPRSRLRVVAVAALLVVVALPL